MTTTAGKLRAVVTADIRDAQKKLREFGDDFSQLRRRAETETGGIAAVFKGTLGAGLVLGGIQTLASGLGNVLSGLWWSAPAWGCRSRCGWARCPVSIPWKRATTDRSRQSAAFGTSP